MVAFSSITSAHNAPRQQQRQSFFGRPPFTNSYRPLANLVLLVTATLLVLSRIPCADAALRNVTVDDEFGDELTKVKPTFLPTTTGVWEGEECTGCRVKPDPALVFNGTYIAATYRKDDGVDAVEFSFQFTGTDVYVFLTLANNAGDGITTLTETNFTIDDGPATLYQHEPDMTTDDIIYQFPAFIQHNLEHRTHTLRARTSGPDYHIFINFDYAIYTYDDTLIPGAAGSTSAPTTTSSTTSGTSASTSSTSSSASSSSSKSIAGPVAGGVIGGLAIFAAFIFALLFIRRRARHGSAQSLADSDTGGVVGVAGAGARGRRNRRQEEKEYPNPEIFASSRLQDTRYARTDAAATVYPPITPFMYTSPGAATGSSHSLAAQTQGGSSSGDGSGGGVAPYPTAPYGAGRGSGGGRGGNTSPQPVHKHRMGDSGGGSSDNTGLSYVTDVRAVGREPQLPAYTPNAQPSANQDVLSVGSGSGSSMSGNPYAGIEESVYAATGVRLEAMQPRTYYALNAQPSSQSLGRGSTSPPPPGTGGAKQPLYPSSTTNLETQIQALQESIRVLIANLQSERETLRSRGVSNEAIQQDEGFERMTETLKRMAEEMSILQEKRRGVGGGQGEESRRTTTTQPPGYESGLGTS